MAASWTFGNLGADEKGMKPMPISDKAVNDTVVVARWGTLSTAMKTVLAIVFILVVTGAGVGIAAAAGAFNNPSEPSKYMTGQDSLDKNKYKGAFYECINGVIWGFDASGDHLGVSFIEKANVDYGNGPVLTPAPMIRMMYDPTKKNGLQTTAAVTLDPPQQIAGIIPASDAYRFDVDFNDDYSLMHPKLLFKHTKTGETVFGLQNNPDFYQQMQTAFGNASGWRNKLMEIDYKVTFGEFVPDAVILGQELFFGAPYTCKRITRSGNIITTGTSHNRYSTGKEDVRIHHPLACKQYMLSSQVTSKAHDPCVHYASYGALQTVELVASTASLQPVAADPRPYLKKAKAEYASYAGIHTADHPFYVGVYFP